MTGSMMKFTEQLFVVIKLMIQLSWGAPSCPKDFANGASKPLYVLSLVSTSGYALLPGHRIAQREINNRTNFLPGYHIELIVDTFESCSSSEAGSIGLSSLLKYTLNPPCYPVIAVAGLGCTSHTSLVSSVAGRDGFDLIQLSSANSPRFETENHHFPHLWRFLGSADVYTDAILALMDQFNWKKVGVIYNTGIRYHSEIAKSLENKIKSSSDKSFTFIFGIRERVKFYMDAAVSEIRRTETTVLVTIIKVSQTGPLLNETIQQGLVYPKYTWIHVEKVQAYFQNQNAVWKDIVFNGTRGHIFLYARARIGQEQTIVSGNMFASFNWS